MKDIVARIKTGTNFSNKFKANVLKEITKKIKRQAPTIKTTITDSLRRAVKEALVSTPEYQSIVQGKLKAELGIPESDIRIASIIDTWVNNIEVKVAVGTTPLLSIDIGIIRDDYGDVLSLPEAQYKYRSNDGDGEIPWLSWLLLEGDRRIITRYEFSSEMKGSRTGMGIMVSKKRGFWQVPPEFSGTSANNFATRAFGNIETVIDNIVEQAIKGSFK